MKVEHITSSQSETEELGEKIAKSIKKGDTIALFGGLGAGKTAFTRGILRGLGYDGIVCSPTFTIVNEYILENCRVVHFDMYRVDDEETLATAGFYDYQENSSIVIIEWSEKVEYLLEYCSFKIIIKGSGEEKRSISIEVENE